MLGENQILGQVREAYEAAQTSASTGPVLNPLFQRAIAVGKQVRTETALAEGRMSIASVAVDYAKRIFESFGDKTALCIGAGKMATLVLEHLVDLKPGNLLLCNRDASKAAALAERFSGIGVPFEQLADHLASADIVVTSTGPNRPDHHQGDVPEEVLRKRRYRPVFIIDIAVPRDVEPAVGELEPVYLYNIDDLQQAVASTQHLRKTAVQAAEKIVEQQIQAFSVWNRQREMGPTIDRLFKSSHEIARKELERTLGNFPPRPGRAGVARRPDPPNRQQNPPSPRPYHAKRRPRASADALCPCD